MKERRAYRRRATHSLDHKAPITFLLSFDESNSSRFGHSSLERGADKDLALEGNLVWGVLDADESRVVGEDKGALLREKSAADEDGGGEDDGFGGEEDASPV